MTRTLFIGLDGATFTVLDDLTRDRPGRGVVMPFLGQFMRSGFSSRLRSTNHPLTPPAWVSLMTGRTPGNHGVFDFVRFEDRGSEIYFTLYDSRDIRCETIWSLASRQDRSVVSLNFPMMAPPETVNGSLIAGFVSWKHLRRAMQPRTLFDRVKAIDGFNPTELAWDFEREANIGMPMTQAELESWVLHHLPREEQWFRIAETLLREDQPDLFAVMFDGTDKIQHQVWHVLDPALRPENPDEDFLRLEKLAQQYFRRLDGYIEKLVALAGPQAQVFMASDHGFTASSLVLRVNRVLADLGYLEFMPSGHTDQERRREDSNFAYLRWDKTLAYCPTPSSNGICIRVADGPGRPGVKPEDYLSFRDRLVADLRALKDPDTGRPLLRDVLIRDVAFPGPEMRKAPDLTVVLSDYSFVSVRNVEPAIFTRPMPVGTHHPDGIFLAGGNGIRAEKRDDLMSIVDVTSILVHSLDLPIPENFEGNIPDSMLDAAWQQAHPFQLGAPARDRSRDDAAPAEEASAEEREKILSQLRALGYLEE